MRKLFVSVVIIFDSLKKDVWLDTCFRKCQELRPLPDEIVLVPDDHSADHYKSNRIKVVVSGDLNIPKKRNMGVKAASKKCDIIAFIDSDAYPDPGWLRNSLKYFEQAEVGAVGGPNMTPPWDPILMRVTGNAMESPFGYGKGYIRHVPVSARFVDTLPTCNLLVRKDLIKKVGYFDERLHTGEDAQLCSDIRKMGKKIYYSPDVRVFHHRRALFKPFFKQAFNYGMLIHKIFIRNPSAHFYLLAPILFFPFVVLGWVALYISSWVALIYKGLWVVYLALLIEESVRTSKSLAEFPLTLLSLFLLHFSYGLGFFVGLFQREKKLEKLDVSRHPIN